MASGLADDRLQVRETLLETWRADPDLAGLRDQDALDDLAPEERRECLMLWSDFDALLNRAWRFR